MTGQFVLGLTLLRVAEDNTALLSLDRRVTVSAVPADQTSSSVECLRRQVYGAVY
jgi:hypothetical protein